MTQRQFLAWSDYLDRMEDEPSLTDHYLMQVAMEIRGSMGGGKDLTIQKFRLSRQAPRSEKQDRLDQERHDADVLAAVKSESLARITAAGREVPVTYRVLTPEERRANLIRAGMLSPDEPEVVEGIERADADPE